MDGLIRFCVMVIALGYLVIKTLDQSSWAALSIAVIGIHTIMVHIDLEILKRKGE